jgi:hypothetical protein
MLNYNAQMEAVFIRQAPLLTYKCSLECCQINRCVQWELNPVSQKRPVDLDIFEIPQSMNQG